jgi:hypothetical protein
MPRTELSEEEFLAILRQCRGLYQKTADAILAEYGIEITRQSVRERALAYPKELAEIDIDRVQRAIQNVDDLLQSQDEGIKKDITKYVLDRRGEGWNPKQQIDANVKTDTVIILPQEDADENDPKYRADGD